MSVVEQDEPTPPASVPLHRRLPGGRTLSDGHRLYWWGEILAVLTFYGVYSFIRNLNHGNPQEAYEHALDIIRWQKSLGINHEQAIQAWALGSRAFIIAANYFYGSVYIAATVLGLIFLYRFHSDDYPLWRNTLAIGTLLGLIGFATFPLMPPRLLDSWADPNGLFQFDANTFFHFKDTLVQYPTFWSFNDEGMKTISNQFAAMPSLHCGWAFWGLAVFYPRVKSWWGKALAVLYPLGALGLVAFLGATLARITQAAHRAPAIAGGLGAAGIVSTYTMLMATDLGLA